MKTSKVYLVGAGPGDLGLLTLKGRQVLESAEVVIYDRLIPERMLQFAPRAQKISAKTDSKDRQNTIHQQLLKYVKKGMAVVRLKGGDPFVYGRGGEEALFLSRHKIPFEVIPGVSAGHAVPAYAGIPVTDRRLASQVTFVTANEDPAKRSSLIDWAHLARLKGTLVLFMGVRSLAQVVSVLGREGMKSRTKVTVIEWGTLPRQRVVEGNLKNIGEKIRRLKIDAPAITVIGEVNQFRKEIAWFEKQALFGKTIILTRDSPNFAAVAAKLESLGAQVLEFPVIQIEPPLFWKEVDEAILGLDRFNWILFTSVHGVEHFFSRLKQLGKDSRALSRVQIGAIGSSTKKSLAQEGISADLVPQAFTAEALVRALNQKMEIRGRTFLLPRTDIAPQYLNQELESLGGRVTQVVMYRTVPVQNAARFQKIRPYLFSPDTWVTFTSSSTVKNFWDPISAQDRRKIKAKMISIGPVTSETLREYGFKSFREAKEHTMEGLVRIIVEG